MKKCEKCSTMNDDSVSFCTNCGSPLGAPMTAPVAPAQPMMAPQAAPGAKKIDGKTIGLVAVAVIGLIVGVVGVVFALTNGKKEDKKEDEKPTVSIDNPSGDDDGGVVISGNSDGSAVKVGPYTLNIPREYQYEVADGGVAIADAGMTWAAVVYYDDTATYNQVVANIDSIGTYLTQQGATNVKTGSSTAGGLSYVYADYIDPTDNYARTASFFKAGLYNFDVTTMDGSTTVASHAMLNDIAKILSTAKEGKTATRDLGFNLDKKGLVIDKDILSTVPAEE